MQHFLKQFKRAVAEKDEEFLKKLFFNFTDSKDRASIQSSIEFYFDFMGVLLDKSEEFGIEPTFKIHRRLPRNSSDMIITVAITYQMNTTKVSFEIARQNKQEATTKDSETKKKISASWIFFAPTFVNPVLS